MKDQESFKPYIPAEKITAEMTATSVIMGIILSVSSALQTPIWACASA